MQTSPRFADLPPIDPVKLHQRRERVFILLAGLFLGTLAMLNLLGVTRFIRLFEVPFGTDPTGEPYYLLFAIAVGALPYPVTFFCTDLISEFYGRRRANFVVFVGLILNLWLIAILWLGAVLPGAEDPEGEPPVFFEVRNLAMAAVGASMIAYIAAQFCDVYMFHFWKRLTRGRWLWLRNNGSTLVSQLIDSVAVITLTYASGGLDRTVAAMPEIPLWAKLGALIASGYAFKLAVALADTLPIYIAVHYLSRYLRIDPWTEGGGDAERVGVAFAVKGEGVPR